MSDLAIETQSLHRHYAGIHAVVGLDIHVPRGSIYGFMGKNGAGKTTTIRYSVSDAIILRLPVRGKMQARKQNLIVLLLISVLAVPWLKVAGQASSALPESALQSHEESATPVSVTTPQLLLDFKESDIKFDLQRLMDTLRDAKHEGWLLAAYPDPKTNRPLIGAGFGLDVEATDHPQSDPLNPHPFIEPSSAQLWQAAGLDPDLMQQILDRFHHDQKLWTKKQYRRKIKMHALQPELTSGEATRLLRISAIQSVQNARAYCRNFDQLTAPQQMALSQMVYQMGVNLEEFVQFLSAINSDTSESTLLQPASYSESESDHWKAVQRTLIESDWARRYTRRATTVIAMFDPDYLQNPRAAELRVEAVLHPPSKHHHKGTRRAQSKRKLA